MLKRVNNWCYSPCSSKKPSTVFPESPGSIIAVPPQEHEWWENKPPFSSASTPPFRAFPHCQWSCFLSPLYHLLRGKDNSIFWTILFAGSMWSDPVWMDGGNGGWNMFCPLSTLLLLEVSSFFFSGRFQHLLLLSSRNTFPIRFHAQKSALGTYLK